VRPILQAGLSASLALLAAAPAQGQNSQLIDSASGDWPVGLSSDGMLIVTTRGYVNRSTGTFIDIGTTSPPAGGWGPTLGGNSGWDFGRVVEVRADGGQALAMVQLADGSGDNYGARWDAVNGWQFPASTVDGCDAFHTSGKDMSDDGAVIVGDVVQPFCDWYATSWLPDAQPDPVKVTTIVYDPLHDAEECSNAECVSGDGLWIGGRQSRLGCHTGFEPWHPPGDVQEQPMVWDTATGTPIVLNEGVHGRVNGLSYDGSVAVGRDAGNGKSDAVIWDMTQAPPAAHYLGLTSPDPNTSDSAEARTVSADGDLVTGSFGNLGNPWAAPGSAFFWKRHTNGNVATQRVAPMAQRIYEAGDAFPAGPLDLGNPSHINTPTSVATIIRDSAGPNGGSIIYDVQIPGGLYVGAAGFPVVMDIPLLEGDTDHLDLTNGSNQVFTIDAGPSQAFQLYVMLGSASEGPGWPVGPRNRVDISSVQTQFDNICNNDPDCTPPATLPSDYTGAGDMTLPLAFDSYFLATATNLLDVFPFNGVGLLGANGQPLGAPPFIGVPAGNFTSLAGATLYHAYAVLDFDDLAVRAVSNAVPCDLTL
jgi:hypothetical protein